MKIKLGLALFTGAVALSFLTGCSAPAHGPNTGVNEQPAEESEATDAELEENNKASIRDNPHLKDIRFLGTIEFQDVYEFHTTDSDNIDVTCILSSGPSNSISCYPSPADRSGSGE